LKGEVKVFSEENRGATSRRRRIAKNLKVALQGESNASNHSARDP